MISKEDWIGRRLVADRFRDRRAFICGDACHLWIPMAGYGMNAGIADAMNLSWQLAARLQGWAADAVLDAYEAERQPITEQVSQFAMNHALALQRQREAVPEGIELPGPQGHALRAATGAALYDLNVQQYCCGGLNFGYFYDTCTVDRLRRRAAPAYTMDKFTPSTVPGCRTPHVWLDDGRSLYDAMGSGYTLLRTDPGIEVDGLVAAAAVADVPLSVLDLSKSEAGHGVRPRTGPVAAGPACRVAGERRPGQSTIADRPDTGRGLVRATERWHDSISPRSALARSWNRARVAAHFRAMPMRSSAQREGPTSSLTRPRTPG